MRAWNPRMGMGELTYEFKDTKFEPDNKAMPTVEIKWVESRTGPADQKKIPRKKAERAEWDNWLTFTLRGGEVLTFRREGPPPQ